MRQEGKNGAPVAALINERFATAQRRARSAKKLENQAAGLVGMNLPIRLLLGPSRAGHKQKFGVGPDSLLVLFRSLLARNGRSHRRKFDRDLLSFYAAHFSRISRMGSRVEQQKPRPRFTLQNRFNALAI